MWVSPQILGQSVYRTERQHIFNPAKLAVCQHPQRPSSNTPPEATFVGFVSFLQSLRVRAWSELPIPGCKQVSHLPPATHLQCLKIPLIQGFSLLGPC